MHVHKKWIILSLSTIIILILTAFTTPVRGIVANGQPGGFVSVLDGTFIDSVTGWEYGFSLVAREADDSAGVGKVTLLVSGPGLSVCSAHGPGAEIDFSPGGEDFGGNVPLSEIQCGTAYGMPVSIDGCTAKTENHGYSHSDYPFHPYMGPSTTEFSLQKKSSGSLVTLKLYIPSGVIKLGGNVNGTVEMDTCP
jgi:hypothetical protein